MFSLIIPAAIKEKLTPSSTDTLVYVLYLQWAYMVTLIVILNLSSELVGDWGCIFLPLVGGCLPAVLLYRVVRKWRMKNVDQKVKQEKGAKEKDTGVKKEVDDTETDGNKKPREEKGIKEEGTVDTKGIKEETMGVEEKETVEIEKEELKELKGILK